MSFSVMLHKHRNTCAQIYCKPKVKLVLYIVRKYTNCSCIFCLTSFEHFTPQSILLRTGWVSKTKPFSLRRSSLAKWSRETCQSHTTNRIKKQCCVLSDKIMTVKLKHRQIDESDSGPATHTNGLAFLQRIWSSRLKKARSLRAACEALGVTLWTAFGPGCF